MGGERHRSVRAQSRRLGGPGWLSAAPGSCSESHGNSGLGQQGGAARGSGGFQACRKRPQAVSCTGLRGASREIAPSFHGFRCFGAESSSEQLQYSRDSEGATPLGRRGKSVLRVSRRMRESGSSVTFWIVFQVYVLIFSADSAIGAQRDDIEATSLRTWYLKNQISAPPVQGLLRDVAARRPLLRFDIGWSINQIRQMFREPMLILAKEVHSPTHLGNGRLGCVLLSADCPAMDPSEDPPTKRKCTRQQ